MEFPRWFQRLWIRAAAGSAVFLTALNGLTQNITSTPPVTTAPLPTLNEYDACQEQCLTEVMQLYNQTGDLIQANDLVTTRCDQACRHTELNNTTTSDSTMMTTSLRAPPNTTANQEDGDSGLSLGLGLAALGVAAGSGLAITIYKHCKDKYAHRTTYSLLEDLDDTEEESSTDSFSIDTEL